MAATKDDIRRWLAEGKRKQATHVIVVCDTYDHEDYPVYVTAKDEAEVLIIVDKYSGQNMQRVMETYSLTGKHSIEKQLSEFRAHHYD